MSRILQAANFVAPHSGGIRTVLEHLARGYAAAGHEVVQVVPGRTPGVLETDWGRRISVAGIPVPGTGYDVLRLRSVVEVASQVEPDRIEVHDRATLRGLGPWARTRGVPAVVISHERLDRLVRQWLPDLRAIGRMAQRSNATLAASFDTVICTTEWAAEEFTTIGVPNLQTVSLGVDTVRFHPGADPQLRRRLVPERTALLVLASRMSREKRPELALLAAGVLRKRGRRVLLAVAGDGPMRPKLERMSRGLPVTFTGHLPREEMPRLLATADVVLAPGPVETFGLAALEALACGTPVVANADSALRGVLGSTGGIACAGTPEALADAVETLLERPVTQRRAAARRTAERYDWSSTVAGFLAAHQLAPSLGRTA